MDDQDRSALFNQLKNFSQRKLKKVETKVVTGTGEQLVEKRGAKGLQVLSGNEAGKGEQAEPARKLDLQVGLVLPGLLIGSQDVAEDKSSLDSYGVTHILNLAGEVENKFEDDYNYKNINIRDSADFELDKVLEDAMDFIDDGRHYGNVLVHCAGTVGLSRSTSICIAYLMSKEKQKFDEAFGNVKEARSFVRPNEGFIKQLKAYEVKLRGVQEVKDSGIDDPFALRKKQEIEQEKAMVAGAASVRNRMKMFGANLDTGSSNNARSKSVSPMPVSLASKSSTVANSASNHPASASNKWAPTSASHAQRDQQPAPISKSMTPEPRRSWQVPSTPNQPAAKPDWRPSAAAVGPPPPPPPPPPMPTGSPLDPKSSSARSPLPPPPPPPPLPPSGGSRVAEEPQQEQQESFASRRMVFGRIPPPPMKIKGGQSIEKHDSLADRNIAKHSSAKSALQLPLKRQPTYESSGENDTGASGAGSLVPKATENPRAPSPSAALRAAKQQAASGKAAVDSVDQPEATDQHRPSVCGQLNRSSTKKLLNLIKTKTKSDLTLPDGDENDEIEALLGALANESIDNIDWDELGLDEEEVKDIIQAGGSSNSDSSSDSEENTDEEEEVEVESSTQHYVIRTK